MATRTSNKEARRGFIFHNQLAEFGPIRITVDGDLRDVKTKRGGTNPAVDVTLYPKNKDPLPFVYWCENDACAEFFARAERGVPFTVVAEGAKADATVLDVGRAAAQQEEAQGPFEQPPEESVPGPEPAPTRQSRSSARHAPAPHDTAKSARTERDHKEELAAKNARVFAARRTSLKRLCVLATVKLNEEAKAVGAPEMPPEMFWRQVTTLYISVEAEGLAIRKGFADALPVDLTFDRLREMSQRKPEAGPSQETAEPTAAEAENTSNSEPF